MISEFVTNVVLPLVGATVGLCVVVIFATLTLLLLRVLYNEFFPRKRR